MIAHSKKFRKSSSKILSNFRKGPSKIFPLFFGLILFLLLGFLVVSNWNINKKRVEFNSRLEILSKKIQNLEEINRDLKGKISVISEESYLEKVAREKFNLRKPGERVVVIKKEKATSSEAERNSFIPQNWLDWIKSKILRE